MSKSKEWWEQTFPINLWDALSRLLFFVICSYVLWVGHVVFLLFETVRSEGSS